MYIREKIGRYAGEIRDFPPRIARELIAKGRAVNPYAEAEAVPEAESVAKPSTTEPHQRKKRNR